MRASLYRGASTTAQWFATAHPGMTMRTVDKVVLHTTEGGSWPAYSGGAVAPNLTVRPNEKTRTLEWRQHFPIGMSSRALENRPGGVDTNTDSVVQVELVGTCDIKVPLFFWPGAPEWALQGLADFLKFMNAEWDVPLTSNVSWLPYPVSYGASSVRMSYSRWTSFTGVCGHQHVPENVHGDPGYLPIAKILKMAGTGVSAQTSQERFTMADFTRQDITDIVTAAIAAQRDEIAADVWNRFVIKGDDGKPQAPLTAIQNILNTNDDPVNLTDAAVDKIVAKLAERLAQPKV